MELFHDNSLILQLTTTFNDTFICVNNNNTQSGSSGSHGGYGGGRGGNGSNGHRGGNGTHGTNGSRGTHGGHASDIRVLIDGMDHHSVVISGTVNETLCIPDGSVKAMRFYANGGNGGHGGDGGR